VRSVQAGAPGPVRHARGRAGARARSGAARLPLEVDDLLHARVDDRALGRDQLLALLRAAVEEARVHLGGRARLGP